VQRIPNPLDVDAITLRRRCAHVASDHDGASLAAALAHAKDSRLALMSAEAIPLIGMLVRFLAAQKRLIGFHDARQRVRRQGPPLPQASRMRWSMNHADF
jgi:hypothetical protein